MKYISVDKLQSGMVCAMTLYNEKLDVLLSANKKISNTIINRLKVLDFNGIYVYDKINTVPYEDLISEETRESALRHLKHIDIDACLYVANQITNEILEKSDVLFDLIAIGAYDTVTYHHSINVALISTMIGVDMGFNNAKLKELAQAALLHDIGKIKIEGGIVKKPGKLTDEEYEEIKNHAYYGYEMLKDKVSVPSTVKNAIYSHHENEDGSGYPRGLKGDKIHIFAKIIHVADVYDALISKRSYKDNVNPAEAFEHLLANVNTLFNEEVVRTLINCVALYPNGMDVVLSNNETATVIKNHKGFPTRPIVLTNDGQTIDLMNTLNLTIVSLKKTFR